MWIVRLHECNQSTNEKKKELKIEDGQEKMLIDYGFAVDTLFANTFYKPITLIASTASEKG